MKEPEHPLETWLRDNGMNRNLFATANKIPFRAIYQHLAGAVKDPRLRVLLEIEKATKGQVTVQTMAAWWKKRL